MDTNTKLLYNKKSLTLFIGEIPDIFSYTQFEIKFLQVQSSSELKNYLNYQPKNIVINVTDEQINIGHFIRQIQSKSPATSIILYGIQSNDLSISTTGHIAACISKDANLETFMATLDKVNFESSFNEKFDASSIQMEDKSLAGGKLIIIVGSIILGLLLSACFMEF